MSACKRLGHLQRLHRAGRAVHAALLHHVAPVEQHPHRLDCVERHALRPCQDLRRQALGEAGDKAVEQRPHRRIPERLEVERREIALAGTPRRPFVDELGPRGRDHVERRVARPLEQVLDEVEQRGVGPLHVLEREHRRVHVCEALEEEPPGREEVFALEPAAALDAEQVGDPRLDEGALVRIDDVGVEHAAELGQDHVGGLLLADAAAHPHHVGQRPVRDALAVGRTAAAVPVDHLGEAVEVLVELPHEPRLADPGDPRDRDEVRTPLVGRGVEEILDLAQLAVTPHERGFEALRLQRPAGAGDDAHRPPQPVQADLALQLVLAHVLVHDRRLGRAPGRVSDEHLPRVGQRLHSRRGIDDVARNHALADGADGDRRLARQHTCAHAQVGHPHLVAQRGHGGDQVERRPHGPLGIVLGGAVGAPDGHHGIADELLDHAAVELDQSPAHVEVAREQRPHLLGVARLRERGETDQVGEQHGDQAPLGRRLWPCRRHGEGDCRSARRGGPGDTEGRAALAAEAVVRGHRGAAGGARRRERCPAAAAEPLAGSIFHSTGGADHGESVRHRPGDSYVLGTLIRPCQPPRAPCSRRSGTTI